MQGKKKAIGNIVFLLAVFVLTVYGIFHGEDMGAMVPGVFLVLFFIWGESVILWYMMRSFRIYIRKRICFLFSSAGFFSAVSRLRRLAGSPCRFII